MRGETIGASIPPTGGAPLTTQFAQAKQLRPTPPYRGRHSGVPDGKAISPFRPTPPYRGRRTPCPAICSTIPFRPTPPYRGRRRRDRSTLWAGQGFDPRPRTGGDLGAAGVQWLMSLFRPTPPYRGRRSSGCRMRVFLPVSTHAPVPGATCGFDSRRPDQPFRPTPPYRGRRAHAHAILNAVMFRPTPPYRGRLQIIHRGDRTDHVSTHAPVPGATIHGGAP